MSDVNLTVQEGSDIYLSLTESPSVVTLSQPVVSGVLSSNVTVSNTVTVALDANSLSALENVTVTVGAAVTISNFPSTQTVAGTVTVGNTIGLTDAVVAGLGSTFGNSDAFKVDIRTPDGSVLDGEASVPVQGTVDIGSIPNVLLTGSNGDPINDGGSIPVFLGQAGEIYGTVTAIIGNTVTIGTYNATYQTGSVLAAGSNISIIGGYRTDDSSAFPISVTSQGRIRVFDIQNSVTIGNVAGFNIPTHDFKSFSYTSGNLTQIAYRTGGASGTTVGILTLAYDGNGNLTSMTKT